MLWLFLLCQISLTLCYDLTPEDLTCFNDYEREMKCSLPSDRLMSCSAYKLDIIHVGFGLIPHKCNFQSQNGRCECKIKVEGFVVRETFSTTLNNETKALLSKNFTTEFFIKPKSPVLSVKKTEKGNFNVTWDDKYEKEESPFVKGLKIHLTYGIKGENERMSIGVENTFGFHDIVSYNLQPNTDYIVTAKMTTDYNDHTIFSDQSEPLQFTTPSSPNEIVKILVPLLCIGLFVIISVIFLCYLRTKRNWWDKISKPKIDIIYGEKKNQFLDPPLMKSSPIRVEVPELDLREKKELISPLSVDTITEKSSHSVESSTVDYGQACTGSGNEQRMNTITLRIAQAMNDDIKLLLCPSNNAPINLDTMSEYNRAKRDSGNCSDSSNFSNMSYLGSATDDSSFLDQPNSGQFNKKKFSDSWESATDFSKSQLNSPINDLVEDEYQSFNVVSDNGNDVDVCVNSSNDVDEKFMKNLIITKNPLYPPLVHHDCGDTTSDDPYQAFEGLTKGSEGQWSTSISTERALTECGGLKFPLSTGQDPTLQHGPWAFSLHMSDVLEVDTSYQVV